MFSALDVAKYIVGYCCDKKHPITNLKLQKMLYFIWVEYYQKYNEALFIDDICAWPLGPVIPEVYYEYCSYAGLPISISEDSCIDAHTALRLEPIIDKYMYEPTSSLVDKTHQAGKPWSLIFKDGVGNRKIIPFSLIRELEV